MPAPSQWAPYKHFSFPLARHSLRASIEFLHSQACRYSTSSDGSGVGNVHTLTRRPPIMDVALVHAMHSDAHETMQELSSNHVEGAGIYSPRQTTMHL